MKTQPIKYLVIHHTAGNEYNTEAIRQAHIRQGWRDIGYNSVIEKNGAIALGRDPKQLGAHSTGVYPGEKYSMNQIGYGLVCIGYFHKDSKHVGDIMPEVQFQSLLRESLRVCKAYNIPIGRVVKHSDVQATACPGSTFPWVRFIGELGKLLNPAQTAPSPILVPLDDDVDVYLTVRVRTSKREMLRQEIIKMGYACKRLDLA